MDKYNLKNNNFADGKRKKGEDRTSNALTWYNYVAQRGERKRNDKKTMREKSDPMRRNPWLISVILGPAGTASA